MLMCVHRGGIFGKGESVRVFEKGKVTFLW